MKITYKGDYALKALFQLALKYKEHEDGIMSIGEIAKHGDMPRKFLEQILLTLRKGGFVKSKRGVGGGFVLAKTPKEITVGDIIRFIEGPIGPIACAKDTYKGCRDMSSCIFRDIWKEVASGVSAIVDELTFEELISRFKKKKSSAGQSADYII